MFLKMFLKWNTFKIADVIVLWITILVVYLIARRNLSVVVFPYNPVQPAPALGEIPLTPVEVVCLSIEDLSLQSLSPGFSSDTFFHPFPTLIL